MLRTENSITLKGLVMHVYQPNTRTAIVTISCSSANKGKEKEFDRPQIIFTKDLAREVAELQPFDHVTISAFCKDNPEGKNTIRGLSFEKSKTDIEKKFGQIDRKIARPVYEDANEALFRGTVTFVTTKPAGNGEVTIIGLHTVKDGRSQYPQIVCFGKVAESAKKHSAGDDLCAICHVQTTKKDRFGNTQHRQCFVCDYLLQAQ